MNNRSSLLRTALSWAANIARYAVVGFALIGVAYVDANGFLSRATLHAQNAIIKNAQAVGNNAGNFSHDKSEALRGGFDPSALIQVELSPPKGNSQLVESAEYHFPFYFPSGQSAQGVSAIDLLCSPNRGASWYSYSSVLANDKRDQFLFEAPAPGEYWFALMTSFETGKRTYSSTRSMTFTLGTNADGTAVGVNSVNGESGVELDASAANDSFALADDLEDDFEVPSFNMPSSDESLDLSELDAPSTLPTAPESSSLHVNNASYAGIDTQPAENLPTAPSNADLETNSTTSPTANINAAPWPGKIKSASFAAGQGTNQLMVAVRWFRPQDLETEYRLEIKAFSIERAPSPTGPWTIIAEDLDVNQSGYSWTATAEEMKPFYIRSVALDSEGNIWRDVPNYSMDVNLPGVRAALGPVKTPVPFAEPKSVNDSETNEEALESTNKNVEKLKLIKHTSSEGEESSEEDEEELDEELPKVKAPMRLVSTVERAQSSASRRERPNIPPPTNPNEFQLNPLFTQGFSVLFQSSQARLEPVGNQKRSIFTPPSRAQRERFVRPAEHRPSQQQLAATRLEQERKAYEERVKYQREHEMEMLAQKPELMEGRMFYMDSNGNLTTTPPAEMQQALAFGNSMEGMGWIPSSVENAAATAGVTIGSGDQALYMPRDAEAYDASARSGAATWDNSAYPQASNPGTSPINNRYSDGNVVAPSPVTSSPNSVPTGTNPQSYYVPSTYAPSTYSSAPSYITNAASAANYAFPPRPSVGQ